MSEQIIEIIISELDFFLIEKVRMLRVKAKPYLSQVALSINLGLSEGFISKVENPKERAKYNIRLLNKLIKSLSLTSYSDIFPIEYLENDIIRIRIKLKKIKKERLGLVIIVLFLMKLFQKNRLTIMKLNLGTRMSFHI